MTKNILSQYQEQKREIIDLRNYINKLKKQIDKIEQEGSVIDSVKGGRGGIERYKIEGFPYPDHCRKRARLIRNMERLEDAEAELITRVGEVEVYIQSISNSRIRRIIRYRFIDELKWSQVAQKIGGNATEDSVKKEFQRFMEDK